MYEIASYKDTLFEINCKALRLITGLSHFKFRRATPFTPITSVTYGTCRFTAEVLRWCLEPAASAAGTHDAGRPYSQNSLQN